MKHVIVKGLFEKAWTDEARRASAAKRKLVKLAVEDHQLSKEDAVKLVETHWEAVSRLGRDAKRTEEAVYARINKQFVVAARVKAARLTHLVLNEKKKGT